MSEDWEQDIIEWVGDRKVKQLNKLSWAKCGLSILAAIGSLGGGWWKMEDRVSKLEEQMAQKQHISNIELDIARLKRDKERSTDRKSQIGSGDRSERIRTYNFPQGRVTDHRINLTLHKLDEFLKGEIHEEMNENLRLKDQDLKLKSLS